MTTDQEKARLIAKVLPLKLTGEELKNYEEMVEADFEHRFHHSHYLQEVKKTLDSHPEYDDIYKTNICRGAEIAEYFVPLELERYNIERWRIFYAKHPETITI